MLTQEYLKSRVHYDPDTGIFTWLAKPRDEFDRQQDYKYWRSRYVGKQIGAADGKGYLHVRFFEKWHRLHRLAFLYMNGVLPVGEVDHINHVRLDNRWCNLREVTVSENRKNQSLSGASTCGVQGVYLQKRTGNFIAQIKHKRKHYYLGSFPTLEGAAEARRTAELSMGFHPNHGQPIQQTIEKTNNALS